MIYGGRPKQTAANLELNEANNALMHARPQQLNHHNQFRDPEDLNMDTEREDEQDDQLMDIDHH